MLRFPSTQNDRQTHLCATCLSRAIQYRHVSTAVAVITRLIYQITGSPYRLLKCISEPLTAKRMPQTSYIVTECQHYFVVLCRLYYPFNARIWNLRSSVVGFFLCSELLWNLSVSFLQNFSHCGL
jgi:hypothetical protein